MVGWLATAVAKRIRIVTTAMTLVEAVAPTTSRAALRWALSFVVVEPVTERLATAAVKLLKEAGLHGHRHAIDAVVAATALAAHGPVSVVTSDLTDLKRLCGSRVKLVKV
jgi:hypothetical protein